MMEDDAKEVEPGVRLFEAKGSKTTRAKAKLLARPTKKTKPKAKSLCAKKEKWLHTQKKSMRAKQTMEDEVVNSLETCAHWNTTQGVLLLGLWV